jgi:DNA polymerase elongation subunit (family B)
LDIQITNKGVQLWIRDSNNRRIKLYDNYHPEFFIEPIGIRASVFKELLEEHEYLFRISTEKRVSSIQKMKEIEVLRLQTISLEYFYKILSEMERSPFVKKCYDSDIEQELKYLADRDLIPFGKIKIVTDEDRNIIKLKPVPENLRVKPPPLTVLRFGMDLKGGLIVTFDPELEVEYVFRGKTQTAVGDFLDHFAEVNPDIIACREKDLVRVLQLSKEFRLRRLGVILKGIPRLWGGRAHVKLTTYGRMALAGLVERVMYTRLPARLSSEWGAGRAIESRQCYEARRTGILIPNRGGFQPVMTLKDLLLRDHGGLIFSPDVGVHENIGALDFESMFPSLISRRNISYENLVSGSRKEGFLVGFTRESLDRRLYFKHLRKELSRDSIEYRWCHARQLALKEILFCTYGYSGCWANRFGNFDTFMEINRQARDTLVESMNVARVLGYKTIYGNNDSLFLNNPNATSEDYKKIATEIAKTVGLPMALENHFRLLVLLPQKDNSIFGAINRYYGITFENEIICRGIELRRRDTPPFIKQTQRKAIEALLSCASAMEVRTRGAEIVNEIIEKACTELKEGKVPKEDLWISIALRQPTHDYRQKASHVAAAEALEMAGFPMSSGSLVDYVYVNAKHENPFRRVRPAGYGGRLDMNKYIDLVREAGRSILVPFKSSDVPYKAKGTNMQLNNWLSKWNGGNKTG